MFLFIPVPVPTYNNSDIILYLVKISANVICKTSERSVNNRGLLERLLHKMALNMPRSINP